MFLHFFASQVQGKKRKNSAKGRHGFTVKVRQIPITTMGICRTFVIFSRSSFTGQMPLHPDSDAKPSQSA